MGIRDEFSDIIGINRTNFVPKSQSAGYELAIDEYADSGRNCVMFDDQSANLRTAKNYGMKTVLCNKTEIDMSGVDHFTPDLHKDLYKIINSIKGKEK